MTVMWASFHAAEKRPEISTDGLHYGPSIRSLVIMVLEYIQIILLTAVKLFHS